MPKFILPTDEQRKYILSAYGEIERRIREREREKISGISRSHCHKLERLGLFPPRCHFGRNSCAWLLSDLLHWVRNPPTVENVNNPYSRKSN
ncbi:helix-turn-helix transcriptional regulator [Xenorhabdus griffiniae]|uniref:AlpA family phage regulatory protein n=1 Tax=Xenorhabdus griffiniae TaxID=351672 RepID=A0ABY9XDJ3_9GAMM|nr:AlpA family phage regulatory protein [Xenorhabdus griffiniae]MBD1228990.1 AlpA family phage regulatory protein [Xenorhabdus griffiniae]MBE8588925.1 AlpA family phage regulatory protein [Xenorhabdus griffiniae]WMV70990.1 AlpA family phage regulatory protein [Xenorhabdus griffiniae]WNH00666.1 AlpA family phage regulatory protein [Xenorhabdus griffiniae]